MVRAQGHMRTWAKWGQGKGQARGHNPQGKEHRPLDTFFLLFEKNIGLTLLLPSDPP